LESPRAIIAAMINLTDNEEDEDDFVADDAAAIAAVVWE